VKRRTARKKPSRTAVPATGTGWPRHLRDAELRLVQTVWEALEVVTGVAFDLVRSSITDEAFLQLLGDALYGFHTHVERPEEYLLLRARNERVPPALDIAAEKADSLGCLCQTIREAILTEPHILSHRVEDRKRVADSLQNVCDAAHTFSCWTEIYPRTPEQVLHPPPGCNRQRALR
jgi:hypothetical protein